MTDLVQIIQVVATLGLVYYAYVTIKEARNDRKKDTIERMLEKIYFPMFDILDRSRHENDRRALVRTLDVTQGESQETGEHWLYIVTPREFAQIGEMVQRFGYYVGAAELDRLRYDLEKASFQQFFASDADVPSWVRLRTDIFDNHWRFFKSRCEELTTELEGLSGISKQA